MRTATVSEVVHPETDEVLGIEIVSNIGNVYFLAANPRYLDLREGPFPNGNFGGMIDARFERRIIAKLEPKEKEKETYR